MYILNMQIITTTDLRTKSKQLVQTLKKGQSIELIHRSQLVGEIRPKIRDPKPFDPDKVARIAKSLDLQDFGSRRMEDNYRSYLTNKYGKNLP
jgi:hypothetical protein